MPTVAGSDEIQTGVYLDKGGTVYNVTHPEYGAVGDGITDDTTAIQDALTDAGAAEGGVVFLPQGIYGVSTDLTVPDGVKVYGVSAGGPRTAAGTTKDLGSVIKWIGGGAPTSAVMTVNLTGTLQFRGVRLKNFRIDANGQATALRALGLGPGCEIDIIVEQFTTSGVVIDRAGGTYPVEGIRANIVAVGKAASRGVILGHTYFSKFKIAASLAVGEVAALARGLDLTHLCQGNDFVVNVEDADLPVDLGTGANGGCVANHFHIVRAENPTIAPTDVTIGAFTGTVLFANRSNATPNTGNSAALIRDEEGFDRMYFDQESTVFEAGAAGKTASYVSHATLLHQHAMSQITGQSVLVQQTQLITALARGDLLTASDADTLARKAIGAAGRILGSDGTDIQWLANLAYATLPTGNGSWDVGAGNKLTFTRAPDFAAGVTLSGNTDVLSVYDEGSWTPTIAGSTTPGSHTYSTQAGSYVRIGKFVIATFLITMTSKDGSIAGFLRINGLPIPCGPRYGVVSFSQSGNIDLNVAGGYYSTGGWVAASQSFIELLESGDNVASAMLGAVDLGASCEWNGVAIYLAA